MKKTEYYHIVFQRGNALKMLILTIFLAIASWPRLLIEVFFRRNMGERYFSLATGITLATVLSLFPVMVAKFRSFYGNGDGAWETIEKNATWYLFLAAFLYMCFRRQKEIAREPGVFDFARFSLSTGIIDPRFYEIRINGKNANPRQIAIFLEPVIPFTAGIVLLLMAQSLGLLLIIASICYSLSYSGAYYLGDNYLMDKIDEIICNENLSASLVDNRRPEETKGFYAYGPRPSNDEFKRRIIDTLMDEEEAAEVF